MGRALIDRDDVELCFELGWTDGLPVVPPTEERVERMLGAAAGRRHEVVAVLEPAGGEATLEKIAANAVMAGCLPQYLPVVVAAVRAVARPEFWLELVVTCNEPTVPLVLVNGPLAREIGMNGDAGCLAGGNRANATIGRALSLVLRNVAGARSIREQEGDALEGTTIGHPGKISFCLTENVEHSPWPELSVERGLAPEQSAVTVFASDAPVTTAEMSRTDPRLVCRTLAESMLAPGTLNSFYREDEIFLIMSPHHATVLAQAGWGRAEVQQSLFEQARSPRSALRERGYDGMMSDLWPAPWHSTDLDPVPIVAAPERFSIAVAGLPHCGLTSICFGFGKSVTVPIGAV